jgi:hypothetical protein
MEAKAKKKRKKHPEEFKREAVRLMESRGERTVADVASGLTYQDTRLNNVDKVGPPSGTLKPEPSIQVVFGALVMTFDSAR